MDSIGNIIQHLLVVSCTLGLLLGCGAEKLSDDQKAPRFANNSAGGSSSLALPRRDESAAASGESTALSQLLAGLHIKASQQTPADTSLLQKSSSRRIGAGDSLNALERRFHIKASGQTPADTSLLPRKQQQQQQQSNKLESPSATYQSRRAGPAHVTLIGPERNLAADASTANLAGRQTPANVGLLRPGGGGGGAPSRPAPAAPQQDGVQREEMTSFKEVNGESIRVVVGNYGYESPEGLPVSYKYMSDENGNQASFSIGTPSGGGGGGSSSRPGAGGGGRGGSGVGADGTSRGTGGGSAAKGAGGGSKTGGATGGDGDRKYLPPK